MNPFNRIEQVMIILAEYTSFPGEKALQKLDLPINKFSAKKKLYIEVMDRFDRFGF